MLRKIGYLFGAIAFFLLGAYAWRVVHTGRPSAVAGNASDSAAAGERVVVQGSIVEVGGTPISSEDLEWEFAQHMRGAIQNDELTPIPDLGPKTDKELNPLRQRLMSGIIERKVLYKYILQDKKFDSDNPARFMDCLKIWQETTQSEPAVYPTEEDRTRLKSRLCERSIVSQYLKERVFAQIKVSEAEITEYFKNHSGEFKRPATATIRQVVLGNEGDAKSVRGKINRGNFAELARENSISPEGQQGGLLGPFSKGEFPNFFNIVFDMQEGQITDIVKSTYGFHIIMLVDKKPRETLSLSDASPKIRSELTRQREREEYRKWVEIALQTVSVNSPKPLW